MHLLFISTVAAICGFCLDVAFGDPNTKWHPICVIGRMVGHLEKMIRPRTGRHPLFGGLLVVIITCLVSFAVPFLILFGAWKLSPIAFFIVEMLLVWFIPASKTLKTESLNVGHALRRQGLEAGRQAVARIVGRDTENLTEEGVIKAAVETVAENTSDGIVAPMFYVFIGGAPLGYLYKAINTMDSMMGYKNDKYILFGRCAAKLDDAANYIPARFSALLMILASAFGGYSYEGARDVWKRDRRNHASPNSAQTESVMAGALEIQLAGDAVYFGKLYKKPFIGEPLRVITAGEIGRSVVLMMRTAWLSLITMILVKGLILVCINMAATFITM
ncbi:MAG: adenosylcobinamide-phosphate synthase CbiB [Lachnospiraceae bacterium]|nr:adenosylcobinamide-phosphate synthase CbiB [Lachnospiraceae bacterium]